MLLRQRHMSSQGGGTAPTGVREVQQRAGLCGTVSPLGTHTYAMWYEASAHMAMMPPQTGWRVGCIGGGPSPAFTCYFCMRPSPAQEAPMLG